MADKLTELQKRVLQFIITDIEDFNRPPSLRELAGELNRHYTQIREVISALVTKGHLIRDPALARGIRLNPERYKVKVVKE